MSFTITRAKILEQINKAGGLDDLYKTLNAAAGDVQKVAAEELKQNHSELRGVDLLKYVRRFDLVKPVKKKKG